jgi:hypothetical protein
MMKRLSLSLALLAAMLAVLGALASPGLGDIWPANRGAVKFCPPYGGVVALRPGQMCEGPVRHQVYLVDSRAREPAAGGYGLCVGVYDPFGHRWVSAPPGRNPRCSHSNYVANYLGDLFGGLTGAPAVLNASAITLYVQSSFSSRYRF